MKEIWGHELKIKNPEENAENKVGYIRYIWIMEEGQFFVEQMPTINGNISKTPVYQVINNIRQSTNFILTHNETNSGYILMPKNQDN